MTQKVCIARVEVRGAAPYLGMCVDTVGREMPVWSDNPPGRAGLAVRRVALSVQSVAHPADEVEPG